MSASTGSSGRRAGLGKGLSALLGEQEPASNTQSGASVQSTRLPIEVLQRNAEQPRRHFDADDMAGLIDSIKQKGILQPILVRPLASSEHFQIVAGERRWRAAQQAGLHEVPVYIRELSDREVMEVALIENMQRADLNPVEEAKGFASLMSQFQHTQEQVAEVVGRSRPYIANMVRLLDLPPVVLDMLVQKSLSAGHARALLLTQDPLKLAKQVVAQGLSVRQVEAMVRQQQKAPETKSKPTSKAAALDADGKALQDQLSQALGLSVFLQQKTNDKGEVRIQYRTLEQLDEICRKLNS